MLMDDWMQTMTLDDADATPMPTLTPMLTRMI
jgi:hypothetical protein